VKPEPKIRIDDFLEDSGTLATLAEDVRQGLTRRPKRLPPKYIYDEVGSRLFEAITRTPEYYVTRTEMQLLQEVAPEVVRQVEPRDLVELGPGSSAKTRALLDAMRDEGLLERYIPVEVSPSMVETASRRLAEEYPGLRIHGVVGDFLRHLDKVPDGDRRLVIFLGSTLGNLAPDEALRFLRHVAGSLGPEDAFLLGADLVKPREVLEAAYNDAEGITARFNRNILDVINRNLGGEFDAERFSHVAFYNPQEARIESYLQADEAHEVRIRDLDLTVRFEKGERIHTEYSHKYTRDSLEAYLGKAGLKLERWFTDDRGWFSLSLARRPSG
jgi:L-histidine N-alpha-methyltransferase